MADIPLLVVDASLQGVSLAIVNAAAPRGAQLLWQGQHSENMGAIAAVAPLAHSGLAALSLKPKDFRGIAVSVGPGSFTGIKVGLAFAYGFKAAFRGRAQAASAAGGALPMLGLSALEAATYVLQRQRPESSLALLVPATRTHGYWAVSKADGSRSSAALVEMGAKAQSIFAELPLDTRFALFGNWLLAQETLSLAGRTGDVLSPHDVCQKAICGMAEMARDSWPDGFRAEVVPPRYLRLSTAEERLQQREEAT